MKKVREEMGLTNVKLMVPFCRTVGEAPGDCRDGRHGLKQHENGLEIYGCARSPAT